MLLRALVVSIAIFGPLHAYLWYRLVHIPAWPAPWPLLASVVLVGLCILIPVSILIRLSRGGPGARAVLLTGYVWLGMVWLFLVAVVITEPIRLVYAAPRELALGALGLALSATVWSLVNSWRGPRVKRVRVELSKLPAAMSGTTIVQLSDVHIGGTVKLRHVEALVGKVNSLAPDLVAITGDLVDGEVDGLGASAAPLAKLESRFGTFFVTGNHEYYSGAEQWVAALRRLDITVLRNQHVRIGSGEASFDLAGVDDPTANHRGGASDVNLACRERDPARELVLLAHQPSSVDAAAANDVGLQLSGHTHSGQIWPFGYLVRLTQPYLRGLHHHTARTQVYVSCGTNHWGPPMRLGSTAEITQLELRRPL
jgi:predicted MPP superfamily phosphohydrolase